MRTPTNGAESEMARTRQTMVGYFCEGGFMRSECWPGGAGIAGVRCGFECDAAIVNRY